MIYYSDVKSLLSQWKERSKKDNQSYCFAIKECMRDLEELVKKSDEEDVLQAIACAPDEELAEYARDLEIDSYLNELDAI